MHCGWLIKMMHFGKWSHIVMSLRFWRTNLSKLNSSALLVNCTFLYKMWHSIFSIKVRLIQKVKHRPYFVHYFILQLTFHQIFLSLESHFVVMYHMWLLIKLDHSSNTLFWNSTSQGSKFPFSSSNSVLPFNITNKSIIIHHNSYL